MSKSKKVSEIIPIESIKEEIHQNPITGGDKNMGVIKEEEWINKVVVNANNGDEESQMILANFYYDYQESGNNFFQAIKWWKEAASQGNTDAMFSLGDAYLCEEYMEKDMDEANSWFMKGAELGDEFCQYQIGLANYYGYGFKQDYVEGLYWFTKAIEGSEGKNIIRLGDFSKSIVCTKLISAETIKNLIKSSNEGDPICQFDLGLCYGYGEGTNQDPVNSRKWLQKSANQGYKEAQYALGNCYYHGYGITQDYEMAVKWFTRAANNGNKNAIKELAVCYIFGYGTNKDLNKAKKLMNQYEEN